MSTWTLSFATLTLDVLAVVVWHWHFEGQLAEDRHTEELHIVPEIWSTGLKFFPSLGLCLCTVCEKIPA